MRLRAVRAAVRGALALPARLSHRRRISAVRRSDSGTPVISFGGVLEERGLVHGGAVKLVHLRDAFAWDEETFNLLYLVSSASPAFAEDLVDHCRNLRIPLVWNQNGVAYPAWAGEDTNSYNDPMRRLRARAQYVVYQSAFCRDSAERFLGHSGAASEVLFNPVDLKKFSPAADPLPATPLKLLTLGTHGYAERVLSTIRCVRALKDAGVDCSLTIAGRLGWPGAGPPRHIVRSLGWILQDGKLFPPLLRMKPLIFIAAITFCSIQSILIPAPPWSSKRSPAGFR